MEHKTKVIEGPFLTRRRARKQERVYPESFRRAAAGYPNELASLVARGVPAWARGARVERAGRFQWVVVATSHAGH